MGNYISTYYTSNLKDQEEKNTNINTNFINEFKKLNINGIIIDKEKINKMIVSSGCYESYPCQHKVSFDNGFIYDMYNGKDIKKIISQYNEINSIKHHLTSHFEQY